MPSARVRTAPEVRPAFYVIDVEYADAASVAEFLRGLRPSIEGLVYVVADSRAGAIAIGATAESTPDRVRRVIDFLDLPGPEYACSYGRRCLRLENCFAGEVAEFLDDLIGPAPGLRIAAEDRSNTLWIATTAGLASEIEEIVKVLEERSGSKTPENRRLWNSGVPAPLRSRL